jgi:hypothetical protein
MPKTPLPPIITDENGDIGFFASVAEAELDLEAVDVRDGIYDVFDSAGHRLAVTAEGESVRICSDQEASADPAELMNRLRRYAARVGPERIGVSDQEGADLQELVGVLSTFFGIR